jgi:hypothetical protein
VAAKKEYPRGELAVREPTNLHQRQAAYIKAQTGYDPDIRTILIVRATMTAFQMSPEEVAIRDAKRSSNGETPEPAAKPARGRKPAAAKAEPAAKPARGRKPKPAAEKAAATTAPATRRGRRTAKPAEEESTTVNENPF